ncbi:MAG: hypothetical protein IPO06_30390 [Leptospiraceae bacterium]|nr:hypothetical protein [Leptospiraceae bacterium]
MLKNKCFFGLRNRLPCEGVGREYLERRAEWTLIKEGEYYASIDIALNEGFSFRPKESQSLLLTFGYQHDPLWIRSKPTRFEIRFLKFFLGILILAPFTNWGGTYYYRDYRVELTNPISTKK